MISVHKNIAQQLHLLFGIQNQNLTNIYILINILKNLVHFCRKETGIVHIGPPILVTLIERSKSKYINIDIQHNHFSYCLSL